MKLVLKGIKLDGVEIKEISFDGDSEDVFKLIEMIGVRDQKSVKMYSKEQIMDKLYTSYNLEDGRGMSRFLNVKCRVIGNKLHIENNIFDLKFNKEKFNKVYGIEIFQTYFEESNKGLYILR